MPPETDSPITCPQCGTPAAGKPADGWLFCARCGASLTQSRCGACGATVAPGAKFCHKCGAPTGVVVTTRSPGSSSMLPWIVTAVALVALIALMAGRGFNRSGAAAPPPGELPQTGLGFDGSQAPVRASTDISRLTPEERADRLFNRVMLLSAEGKTDSVRFFAPMAINAYQMIGPLNADQRYDLGRIAEVAGALPLARAQADSILREQPSHLLGLVLAARVATLERDTAELRRIEARLLSAERAELARALPEYQRHEADIMSALAQARRGAR
jgi:hypothetical protein